MDEKRVRELAEQLLAETAGQLADKAVQWRIKASDLRYKSRPDYDAAYRADTIAETLEELATTIAAAASGGGDNAQ